MAKFICMALLYTYLMHLTFHVSKSAPLQLFIELIQVNWINDILNPFLLPSYVRLVGINNAVYLEHFLMDKYLFFIKQGQRFSIRMKAKSLLKFCELWEDGIEIYITIVLIIYPGKF